MFRVASLVLFSIVLQSCSAAHEATLCISPTQQRAPTTFAEAANVSVVAFSRVSGAIQCATLGLPAPFGCAAGSRGLPGIQCATLGLPAPFGCAAGSRGLPGLPDTLPLPALGIFITDAANQTLLPSGNVKDYVPYPGAASASRQV